MGMMQVLTVHAQTQAIVADMRAAPHKMIGRTITVLASVGKVGIMVDVAVLNVRNAWGRTDILIMGSGVGHTQGWVSLDTLQIHGVK